MSYIKARLHKQGQVFCQSVNLKTLHETSCLISELEYNEVNSHTLQNSQRFKFCFSLRGYNCAVLELTF